MTALEAAEAALREHLDTVPEHDDLHCVMCRGLRARINALRRLAAS